MDTPDTSPTPIERIGATVRRPAGPGTAAVHALLRHLEAVGFPGSPRVVGDGYDADRRQVPTYLEGASRVDGSPAPLGSGLAGAGGGVDAPPPDPLARAIRV